MTDRGGKHFIVFLFILLFKKDLIYLFLERGEGRVRERKRNIDQMLLARLPTGDLESNQQPFRLRDDAQPTEPHQSGLHCFGLRSHVSVF